MEGAVLHTIMQLEGFIAARALDVKQEQAKAVSLYMSG
jgi:hypothetical protein